MPRANANANVKFHVAFCVYVRNAKNVYCFGLRVRCFTLSGAAFPIPINACSVSKTSALPKVCPAMSFLLCVKVQCSDSFLALLSVAISISQEIHGSDHFANKVRVHLPRK